MKQSNMDWTPIRRGGIYCSPLCGGGCTYAAFVKAIKDGDILATQCGPGYTRHVHENLGWHFGAISPCRRMFVTKGGTRAFTAYLGAKDSYSGHYVGRGTTPRLAIQDAINVCKADLERIGAYIVGL